MQNHPFLLALFIALVFQLDLFGQEHEKNLSEYQSIKKRVPNTKIFNFDRNLSYTNSVNCILSHATGKKVLFVSNDVFINPYYIEEVLKISNLSKKMG
mgnify:CR=1 FL=1